MRHPLAILVGLAVLSGTGCASSGRLNTASASALAVRSVQTRSFEGSDRRAVLSALVQGVQDAGFQVTQVDAETGFVSANLERMEGHDAPRLLKGLLVSYYLLAPKLFNHRKQVVLEATGTVAVEGTATRVRIVCRRKVFDSQGAAREIRDVDDAQFYQDLFVRIDKALFLSREQVG